jgi:hypothetical protein
MTQWQGSLNRARQLYMIGEVKWSPDGNEAIYMEWICFRAVADLAAAHAMATPPFADFDQPAKLLNDAASPA